MIFFSLSKLKSIVIAMEIELRCQVAIPGCCDQRGVLESGIFHSGIKALLTCLEIILGRTTAKQHRWCFKNSIKQKTRYPIWAKCQPVWVSPRREPAQIQSELQLGGGLIRENTKLMILHQRNEKFQGPVSMKRPAPSCGIIINWSVYCLNYVTCVFLP